MFPKSTYPNAYEFYSNFGQASIPFFGDFSIQVVPDENDDGTENVCYKSAINLAAASVATTLLVLGLAIQ